MSAQPALRLVSDHDSDFPWPDGNGELISLEQAIDRVKGILYENEGLTTLTKKQAKENAQLQKRITADEDPMNHAKGAEIVALIERWMQATGHTKSKMSGDRTKFVKARLGEGYSIEQLELAVDGIAAFPFVGTGGQRFANGKPNQRHDRLGIALAGGESVEKFAVLGHEARRQGLVTWGDTDA